MPLTSALPLASTCYRSAHTILPLYHTGYASSLPSCTAQGSPYTLVVLGGGVGVCVHRCLVVVSGTRRTTARTSRPQEWYGHLKKYFIRALEEDGDPCARLVVRADAATLHGSKLKQARRRSYPFWARHLTNASPKTVATAVSSSGPPLLSKCSAACDCLAAPRQRLL